MDFEATATNRNVGWFTSGVGAEIFSRRKFHSLAFEFGGRRLSGRRRSYLHRLKTGSIPPTVFGGKRRPLFIMF